MCMDVYIYVHACVHVYIYMWKNLICLMYSLVF